MKQGTVVQIREVSDHLGNPGWVIVDCRNRLDDGKAGLEAYLAEHIPGAIHADLRQDLSGPPLTDRGRHPLPDPEQLTVLFSRMGILPGHRVVAYDDAGGSMAARLWWLLRYLGHETVGVLDGGWQAWQQAGLPGESGGRQNAPAAFTGAARNDWLVRLEQVLDQELLVDSREPARYRGDMEPIDPVAGHIPGAVNRCWRDNLDKDGRFRPPDAIRRELLDLFNGVAPEAAAYYCGSGVTACHNLLAAEFAGFPAGRLYAGSWSEWCSDPERPVATGS